MYHRNGLPAAHSWMVALHWQNIGETSSNIILFVTRSSDNQLDRLCNLMSVSEASLFLGFSLIEIPAASHVSTAIDLRGVRSSQK